MSHGVVVFDGFRTVPGPQWRLLPPFAGMLLAPPAWASGWVVLAKL